MLILVVEDDPLVSRLIVKLAEPFGEVALVTTASAARHAIADGARAWGAFVIDIGLPDGLGTDVLRFARRSYPTTPAVCFTGLPGSEVANAAYDLRAAFFRKPLEAHRLLRFLRDASAHDSSGADPVETTCREWESRHGLTLDQADVFLKTVAGETCQWIADSRGTTTSAIKSLWKTIRIKTGDPTIDAAVKRLLKEAARFGRGKKKSKS
jgi:DNA-binding NarL/FixJ family response regulator